MKHTIPVRVYYEDTDAGGVVYHANYLNFAERGRTEFLRHTGFENKRLHDETGMIFVVRHIDIHYMKPAFLDDVLMLSTAVGEIRNTSFIMKQSITRPDNNGQHDQNHDRNPARTDLSKDELICEMQVVIVCVDAKTYKPARLPEHIKKAFENHTEE